MSHFHQQKKRVGDDSTILDIEGADKKQKNTRYHQSRAQYRSPNPKIKRPIDRNSTRARCGLSDSRRRLHVGELASDLRPATTAAAQLAATKPIELNWPSRRRPPSLRHSIDNLRRQRLAAAIQGSGGGDGCERKRACERARERGGRVRARGGQALAPLIHD